MYMISLKKVLRTELVMFCHSSVMLSEDALLAKGGKSTLRAVDFWVV